MARYEGFIAALPSSAPQSVVRTAAYVLVWVAIASGAIVFTEPAPVDVLMSAMAVALPIVGLVRLTPAILALAAVFMLLGAGAILASIGVELQQRATIHTTISIYLYVSAIVLAAFVADNPRRHTELILGAYVAAALVASAAGVAGYFGLIPGFEELLTRYGRARGTFKDPNVLGAFLVPALIYLLHKAMSAPLRAMAPIAAAGLLISLAMLLSFSRGAWINLAVAVMVFGYLRLVTTESARERFRLLGMAVSGMVVAAVGLVVALQSEAVGKLLSERASMTQSYDVGPEGRFGGQVKAVRLILEHPLGLGAQQFTPLFHHEEPHNVYLNMHLNAGWIGGLTFLVLMLALALLGLRQAFIRGPEQPLFIVVLAAFVGVALEGAIIDCDHWRHLYVIIALLVGLMSTNQSRDAARFLQRASEPQTRSSRGVLGDKFRP